MKKYLYLLLFLLSFSIKAQSIDFSGGYTADGFGGNFDYNLYMSNDSYLQLGFNTLFAKNIFTTEDDSFDVSYNNYLFNAGYFLPLLENNSQTMQVSAGLGVSIGYESIGTVDNLLREIEIESTSSLVYGGFLSGEVNISIARNLLLLGKFNQYYHLGSTTGSMSIYTGIGIRFYLE